ncbi:MAG TPA: hypothetical protein VF519_05575 [Mycobacteriales bacterium]
MTRARRLAAAALVPALLAGAVAVHDSRRRVVEGGRLDGHEWAVVASRGFHGTCLVLEVDGAVTSGGCGFGPGEPDATGAVAGRTVLFGPAPRGARRSPWSTWWPASTSGCAPGR